MFLYLSFRIFSHSFYRPVIIFYVEWMTNQLIFFTHRSSRMINRSANRLSFPYYSLLYDVWKKTACCEIPTNGATNCSRIFMPWIEFTETGSDLGRKPLNATFGNWSIDQRRYIILLDRRCGKYVYEIAIHHVVDVELQVWLVPK